jgi:hypothetical protein
MIPRTTADGEIVWSCKAAADKHLNVDEVISFIAEKLANYISRRFRGADRQPRKVPKNHLGSSAGGGTRTRTSLSG